MKQDPFANVYRALTPKELAEMFMNPNAPKTEAEHWAAREIEKLRAEVERLARERNEARAEVARLLLESEVLAKHEGSPGREWHSAGAWLLPGDRINVMRAPLPEMEAKP